jgi:hypothetical protein
MVGVSSRSQVQDRVALLPVRQTALIEAALL